MITIATIALAMSGCFFAGITMGIVIAKRMVIVAIHKSDLGADNKRMIRDTLGIPPE